MAFDFSAKHKPIATFSQVGLSDVTMLLLIFFLLTSSFISEQGFKVNLPKANTQVSGAGGLIVVINSENKIWFMGKERSPEALKDILAQNKGEQQVVQIRADELALHRTVSFVANAAQEAGLSIQIATNLPASQN
jgi:biopolymer transport protein ExbD